MSLLRRVLDPRPWLALAATLLVAWLAYGDLDRRSPGPLSASHAHAAQLPDGASCVECHGGGGPAEMARACTECHAEIGAQRADGSGFHGALERAQLDDCGSCHPDHHGRDFQVVSAMSFRRAGFERREDFDHGMLDYRLEGAHEALSCADCHPHADADWLRAGEKRFLGNVQDCTSCHDDAHDGRMVRGCEECHGQERPFPEAALFEHHADFPLTGSHAQHACHDCHPAGSALAFEELDGRLARADWRQCADCHETPHRDEFVRAAAAAAGMTAASSCEECHPAAHEDFATARGAFSEAQHSAFTPFALEAPHAGLECADCHGAAPDATPMPAAQWAARFPGRAARTCIGCHEDEHRGQFDDGPHAQDGCLSCHAVHQFLPVEFGVEEHAGLALPLDGAHRKLECAECHLVERIAGGEARRFRGVASDCASCHDDAHRGRFTAGCEQCHVPHGFRLADPAGAPLAGAFDHARWTLFELHGAHAQAECAACHGAGAARQLGFAEDRFPAPAGHPPSAGDCARCHADVHEDFPQAVAGSARDQCSTCHSATSFKLASQDFDHGAWTGFPLDGAHKEQACAACHDARLNPVYHPRAALRGVEAPATQRRLGLARGASCVDCHGDPHVGQFRDAAGRVDCARCHTTDGAFALGAFDHDRDTRFKLDDDHRQLDCAQCHQPTPLPDGREVVRYRPLGRECSSCHGFR